MSYAQQRPLTLDFQAGETDGTYKKGIRERGGFPEHTTPDQRDAFADTWYGIHEAPVKTDPFGRKITTPNTHTGGPVAYPGS